MQIKEHSGEFSKARPQSKRVPGVLGGPGWKRPEEQKQDFEGVVAGGEVAEWQQGQAGGSRSRGARKELENHEKDGCSGSGGDQPEG